MIYPSDDILFSFQFFHNRELVLHDGWTDKPQQNAHMTLLDRYKFFRINCTRLVGTHSNSEVY